MSTSWYVVMLPGEDAGSCEMYGPFRSRPPADDLASTWTAAHPSDPATVMPVLPPAEMR